MRDSVADAAVDLEDFDRYAVHGLEDEPHAHAVCVWTDLQLAVEEGLEALELREVGVGFRLLLVTWSGSRDGRKGGAFDWLLGVEMGAVIEEAEVGADEGGEAGGGRGAIAEVREVEREATEASCGRRVVGAPEKAVGKEERLESHCPGAGAFGAAGDNPHRRVEERGGGGVGPPEDAPRALVIHRAFVVARGPNHLRLHLRPSWTTGEVVAAGLGHRRQTEALFILGGRRHATPPLARRRHGE